MEKPPKTERIKKNIKKIREEKKKEKEVAFTKEKLPEKKKKNEVAKAPGVVIRDVDAGRARRTPASPSIGMRRDTRNWWRNQQRRRQRAERNNLVGSILKWDFSQSQLSCPPSSYKESTH